MLLALFLLQITPALTFFIDERQSPMSHQWSYGGQQEWPRSHRQCGAKAQSPIDIQRKYVIQGGQLKLRFFNYNQPTRFKVQNAHHTIKLSPVEQPHFSTSYGHYQRAGLHDQRQQAAVTSSANGGPASNFASSKLAAEEAGSGAAAGPTLPLPADESEDMVEPAEFEATNDNSVLAKQVGGASDNIEHNAILGRNQGYNGAPTIKLEWLDDGNNEYKLRDIHFHWGERRDNGSEHAIDGRRAAMEMHLVHIKHGLDKSKIGFTSDSVTVIAILIDSYRKSNADFNPIVNALNSINMTEQSQEIEYKTINDLLPSMLTSFYTYSGSLTTPPCYQVVNWIVMSERLYLNAKQIEIFRNLYAPASSQQQHHGQHDYTGSSSPGDQQQSAELIMPNIRQLQPLNNRIILSSFAPLSRLELGQTGQSYSASVGSISGLSAYHNGLFIASLLLACVLELKQRQPVV